MRSASADITPDSLARTRASSTCHAYDVDGGMKVDPGIDCFLAFYVQRLEPEWLCRRPAHNSRRIDALVGSDLYRIDGGFYSLPPPSRMARHGRLLSPA